MNRWVFRNNEIILFHIFKFQQKLDFYYPFYLFVTLSVLSLLRNCSFGVGVFTQVVRAKESTQKDMLSQVQNPLSNQWTALFFQEWNREASLDILLFRKRPWCLDPHQFLFWPLDENNIFLYAFTSLDDFSLKGGS